MAEYEVSVGSPEQDDDFVDEQPQKKQRKSAAGRKLVRWDVDMDQLVLLCADTVCTKMGMPIPWSDVAALVKPGLTGEAIKQHLAKVHKFRAEAGHQVPEKIERNERRKAASIPARSRTKKQDEDDDEQTIKTVRAGSSLLYTKPTPKKKTPKKQAAQEETPKAARSGKKNVKNQNTPETRNKLKAEDIEYDGVQTPQAPRGNKRGRKVKDRELDSLLASDSPSKKPKTSSYLRIKSPINYSEQLLDEDDDEISPQGSANQNAKYDESHDASCGDSVEAVPSRNYYSPGANTKAVADVTAESSHESIYDIPPPLFTSRDQHNTHLHQSATATTGYGSVAVQRHPSPMVNRYNDYATLPAGHGLPTVGIIDRPSTMQMYGKPGVMPYTGPGGMQYGMQSSDDVFNNDYGDVSMQMHTDHSHQFRGIGPFAANESIAFTPINGSQHVMHNIGTINTATTSPLLDGTDFMAATADHPVIPTTLQISPPMSDPSSMTVSPTDMHHSSDNHLGFLSQSIDNELDYPEHKHHVSFDSGYNSVFPGDMNFDEANAYY